VELNNINNLVPTGINSGIYKITSPNGYYYIGSSVNIKERVYNHFYELRKNKHHTRLFQRMYNAHCDWIWSVELLQEVVLVDDWLIPTEQEYLDECCDTDKCMNVNPIACKPPSPLGKGRGKGNGTKRGAYTAEHRAKISAAMAGRKPTQEQIAKRVAKIKGRPLSAEHCRKKSIALKGKPWSEARRIAQNKL